MYTINVGISVCLLGSKVRFDGQHKRDGYIVGTLGKYFHWVPSCPEHDCGMPIPRESMRLVGDENSPRLMTGKTKQDKTEQLCGWSEKRLDELELKNLCGYILKKGSPSCGMGGVRIYHEKNGMPYASSAGLFAKMLKERFPLLPIEDEGRLHDPGLRENFIERVFVYHRWQQFRQDGFTMKGLVEFHSRHKYLIMAHGPKPLRALGAIVANLDKSQLEEKCVEYFIELMAALKLKATVKKNVNVLQHIAGYFKKQLSGDEKAELVDIIEQYHSGLVPQIVPITLLKHFVRKYNQEYLKGQYYLEPHPLEMMLRNHV